MLCQNRHCAMPLLVLQMSFSGLVLTSGLVCYCMSTGSLCGLKVEGTGWDGVTMVDQAFV